MNLPTARVERDEQGVLLDLCVQSRPMPPGGQGGTEGRPHRHDLLAQTQGLAVHNEFLARVQQDLEVARLVRRGQPHLQRRVARALKKSQVFIEGVGFRLETAYWCARDLCYPDYVAMAARDCSKAK